MGAFLREDDSGDTEKKRETLENPILIWFTKHTQTHIVITYIKKIFFYFELSLF